MVDGFLQDTLMKGVVEQQTVFLQRIVDELGHTDRDFFSLFVFGVTYNFLSVTNEDLYQQQLFPVEQHGFGSLAGNVGEGGYILGHSRIIAGRSIGDRGVCRRSVVRNRGNTLFRGWEWGWGGETVLV